jgi:hypothetical protein
MLDISLTPEHEAEPVFAEVLQRYESSSEAHGIRQENLTGKPMSDLRTMHSPTLVYTPATDK